MTILVCFCAIAMSTIVLTSIAAKYFFRCCHLLLRHTNQELWILAESHRSTQHSFWCGLDRKHPHRRLRCPLYLPPLALVCRIVHPRNDRGCANELFAVKQPARSAHRRLPNQFHRADCDVNVPDSGSEHFEPHCTSIRRNGHSLFFRSRKHHRASDFPSRRCTKLFARQDHSHSNPVRFNCPGSGALRILPLVEQTLCKRIRILGSLKIIAKLFALPNRH
jgi:hypothetical protein